MRLRHVKTAEKQIAEHPEHIISIDRKDVYYLHNAFKDKKPLKVEIGSGKGQFSHTYAKTHPESNLLAIERFDSVIVRALDKVLIEPLKNLYLVRMDAQQLDSCLPPHTVETIFLNFSDPWPKAKHEKRRLTHHDFLKQYHVLLSKEGTIELKTDNRHFFEYSLISMNTYNMVFHTISLDLHKDQPHDNIKTEFEDKFSKHGPIYKIIASFKEATHNETDLH